MKLPDPTIEEPAAAGRRAQLLLALLLLCIFPICFLYVPIRTHSVKVDLPRLPDRIVRAAPATPPPPVYLRSLPIPPAPDVEPEAPRPFHGLVITSGNALLWNGRKVELAELRSRLDIIETRAEWVDLRPEPNARYELFAEVIAVIKRARIERLRLDSRPFRNAIDERPEPFRPPL
jgi:biopolymer transport protein ExbD